MPGFRFKPEERALLVNVAKAALSDFEEKAKKAKDDIELCGMLHSADTMRVVVDKLDRNATED